MRGVFPWPVSLLFCAVLAAAIALPAQEPDPFHWVNFHSEKDQDVVVWVTRALAVENWTAIREIGVEYDAALVVTTNRANPQAAPNADSFTLWSVSLTNHALTPLLKGYNLRWLDRMTFSDGGQPELPVLYDNCIECAPETLFTVFHYDRTQHIFVGRWMSGGQGVPVWDANTQPGVTWSQAYAGLAEPNGRELLGTWRHFDYGSERPPEDFVYRYELDPLSGLERTEQLKGKEADALKLRICRDALPGLARGQDSELCRELVNPHPGRKPVTTPPANNRGKSVPGGRPH